MSDKNGNHEKRNVRRLILAARRVVEKLPAQEIRYRRREWPRSAGPFFITNARMADLIDAVEAFAEGKRPTLQQADAIRDGLRRNARKTPPNKEMMRRLTDASRGVSARREVLS
jgi:hypothetical protein